MIALFRINDPYRLILVFLVLVGVRLPFFLGDMLPSVWQFRWMLTGEQLAEGNILYRDVYDHLSPLSAVFFQFTDWLFGRNVLVSAILAGLFTFLQAVLFNNLLLKNKAFTEGSYLPAYMFVLFSSLHSDFLMVTPALLSLTFILMALSNIFRRIDNQTRDELFSATGVYLGIATLFYLPAVVIFLTFLVILVAYSNSQFRRLMLMSVGFLLMLCLVGSYYFFLGDFKIFWSLYINSLWDIDKNLRMNSFQALILAGLPLLAIMLGISFIYLRGKYNNYQLRFQQAMLYIAASGVITWLIASNSGYYSWIMVMPTAAFFTTHLVLLIRKSWQRELFNLALLAVIVTAGIYSYRLLKEQEPDYLVEETAPAILKGKKVLVLGNRISYYRDATPVTPFINWRVCENLFNNTGYYDNLVIINRALETSPPEVIADVSSLMPELMDKIPALKNQYRPLKGYPGFYLLTASGTVISN